MNTPSLFGIYISGYKDIHFGFVSDLSMDSYSVQARGNASVDCNTHVITVVFLDVDAASIMCIDILGTDICFIVMIRVNGDAAGSVDSAIDVHRQL